MTLSGNGVKSSLFYQISDDSNLSLHSTEIETILNTAQPAVFLSHMMPN